MMFRRRLLQVALVGLVYGALGACSNSDESVGENATLPHFHDLVSAPPRIQTAARAVVRLHTARSYGTGAFISSTGLLLTNNHVLGETVCPSEGCYVEVATSHQRGEARVDAETYRAVPVAIDAGLDIAVVQLFDTAGERQPTTSDFLEIDAQEAPELLARHVTVVGHPEGRLKKWTDGIVTDSSGKWITTTAYVLPGDSGSPILSDEGRLVGIIHRAPASLDLISDQGVNVYSIGTASGPLKTILDAEVPSTMVSVAADTTEEEFLANELLYLNSRTETVSIGGTSVSAIELLGRACDAALTRTDFSSLDEFEETLRPCYHAQTWIECRADASPVPYGVVCPQVAERESWRKRFQSINALQMAMNGIADYYTIGPVIARLEPSIENGNLAGAASLMQLLDASSPVLDFEVAYYLSMFAIDAFEGAKVSDFVTGYSRVKNYELDADYIAFSAAWLARSKAVTPAKVLSLLRQLLSDPKVSVGTKLSIEDYLYESEVL